MKTRGGAFGLAIFFFISYKDAFKSATLNDDVTTIVSISHPAIKADNLVKDYLPEPPTPTKSAFDPGISRIRTICEICSMAYKKSTRGIAGLVSLYS